MKKKYYSYFVSYFYVINKENNPPISGYGNIQILSTKKIKYYEDVKQIHEYIEKENPEFTPPVIVLGYNYLGKVVKDD